MPQTAVTTVAVGFVLAFAGSCVIFVPGLGCTTITLESEMQIFSSFSFLRLLKKKKQKKKRKKKRTTYLIRVSLSQAQTTKNVIRVSFGLGDEPGVSCWHHTACPYDLRPRYRNTWHNQCRLCGNKI